MHLYNTLHAAINAQVSPLPAAFHWQAAANKLSDEAEMIIKFNVPTILQKKNFPSLNLSPKYFLRKKWLEHKADVEQ